MIGINIDPLIRVYSDIHLDHYNNEKYRWYPPSLPTDSETTLILAGDLWFGTNFISFGNESWIGEVATQFKQVLIVLGNHDYWKCNNKLSIVNGAEKCRALLLEKKILNVKILDCDTHLDGDVLFVGCTLWTDMNGADKLAMHNMREFMKYDGQIVFESGNETYTKFSSYKWISTHYKHRDYLKIIIEQNRDKKIVVITHHSPLIDDELVRNFNVSNAYYMTDLTELIMENPHVKLWVYGHIHTPLDIIKGQTRFLNNAVGYKRHKTDVKHEVIRIYE